MNNHAIILLSCSKIKHIYLITEVETMIYIYPMMVVRVIQKVLLLSFQSLLSFNNISPTITSQELCQLSQGHVSVVGLTTKKKHTHMGLSEI